MGTVNTLKDFGSGSIIVSAGHSLNFLHINGHEDQPKVAPVSVARRLAPKSNGSRSDLERASRSEKKEPYRKYLKKCDAAIGQITLLTDYNKDLKDRPLKEALKICDEALAYGYDKGSALAVLNQRLRFYFRKALIECNLVECNLDFKDRPLATIGQALEEVRTFNLASVDQSTAANKSELRVLENYKEAFDKQQESYRSELSAITAVALDQADSLVSKGEDTEAVEVLEYILFENQNFQDLKLAIEENIPVINQLIEISLRSGDFDNARDYAEYFLDSLRKLATDIDLQDNPDEKQVMRLANNIKKLFAKQVSAALEALTVIQERLSKSSELASTIDSLKRIEAKPATQLDAVHDLMQKKPDDAYLMAIEQALRFQEELSTDDPDVLLLWILKAEAELQLAEPETLLSSLDTIKSSQEGKMPMNLFETYGDESLAALKKIFAVYVFESKDEALQLARKFLDDTQEIKADSAPLRELAYWLEIKCLRDQKMPIGENIKKNIREEFPEGSKLLSKLLES